MKKKIGDLTINELLYYFKKKCRKISCGDCPFACIGCMGTEDLLSELIDDVGKNTLIEVEDE
jgi:hypothetical protein